MKIAILYGGDSEEREISLVSGKAIYDSLIKRSYDVELIDTKYNFIDKLLKNRFDLVFIALHGKDGEDGSIQGLLQSLNIPYTGSGVLSSAICMNKIISKKIVNSEGFKTPKTFFSNSIPKESEFPLIAKPINGGSSIRTIILRTKNDFEQYINKNDISDIMFESFIEGKEITVGLLELTKPIALTPIEIRPKNEFYDYESKYVKGMTDYIMPPEIPEDKTKEIKNIAIKLFKLLKCQGFARADFIYDGEDFYFLEMNTIPGFTPTSDIPIAAEFDGISFDEVVEIILKSAFKSKII